MDDWLNIGKVEMNDEYVMVNPNYPQIDSPEGYYDFEYHAIKYSNRLDGTGTVSDGIPVLYKDSIVVYDEYKDTYYADALLGKKKIVTVDDEKAHEWFINHLERKGNMVVLKHDSNIKILNDIIEPGHEKQGYSNNSDYGIYFWGSEKKGQDQSNNQRYVYYCLVPIEEVYDITNNLEDFKSIAKANEVYDYIAYKWPRGDGAIAVVSKKPTPIWKVVNGIG
jgi:5-deoxy-D-glucuronate isomerase